MGRNAEITRDFYEAYNRRDWEALASLLAPAVEWFHAGRGERIQGVEAVTALLRSSAEAFPEARVAVSAVHETEASVTTEWSYVGARRQAARSALACDVKELRDGKLVRGATYGDTLQMLLDLDAGPAPAWGEGEVEVEEPAWDELEREGEEPAWDELEGEEPAWGEVEGEEPAWGEVEDEESGWGEKAEGAAGAGSSPGPGPGPGPARSIIPAAPGTPVIRYQAA